MFFNPVLSHTKICHPWGEMIFLKSPPPGFLSRALVVATTSLIFYQFL